MSAPSLFTPSGHRKYLDREERLRFLAAVEKRHGPERLLCLLLIWSGARLSEVLALRPEHVSFTERMVVFRSLKKRGQIVHRHVPLPLDVIHELSKPHALPLPWARTQAWAAVKNIMKEARIQGPQACPRGLRHSFAIHAVTSGVPLHLIQRWLGHTRLETTAIYSQVLGAEERSIAERMW
ncbi:tyrosine-type recombinase/integrase [Aliiroseovarius sp.]|uniref:tyrosine-type recombinase/integrase n=1 Tax=Aliiroseovarius sp. TaxID=1872442 RepID=UPI003BACD0BE